MLSFGDRAALTLIELLLVLAIGVILAATVVPALIGGLDRTRVDESAASLAALGDAIGSMHLDTNRYPGRLSHLSDPVSAVDSDVCGILYGAAATAWAGPYVDRGIAATGVPLPIGVARNLLSYLAAPPRLRIHVDSVSHEDARALNLQLDADADSLGGAIRWGPVSGSGLVELFYVRPVRSC